MRMSDWSSDVCSSDRMRRHLLENPDFKDSAGRFDRDRFAQLLRYSGLNEQGYLARIGEDTKRQQLVAAVTEAAVAPESLAERLFVYREERRVAAYVTIASDSITGQIGRAHV